MTPRWRAAVVAAAAAVAGGAVWAQQRPDVERVRQQLVGSYKLVWYVSYDRNGVETKLPYSVGQISYDAAGRMSAQLMRDDRPRFSSPPTEAERAAAYSGFISYFGRYEIDPEKRILIHHEGAVSPNMVGQGMVRHYEFSADGRTLFLSVKDGDRVTGKLQWDRHR
jgi:hypothetical protein